MDAFFNAAGIEKNSIEVLSRFPAIEGVQIEGSFTELFHGEVIFINDDNVVRAFFLGKSGDIYSRIRRADAIFAENTHVSQCDDECVVSLDLLSGVIRCAKSDLVSNRGLITRTSMIVN